MSNPKSVVVTGVSSGIGFAITQALIERGYRVFGSVRKLPDAGQLAHLGGELFVPLVADVTDEQSLIEAANLVRDKLAGDVLFGLINNAGINSLGPLAYQPMAEIRNVFEVNTFGVMSATRIFLPALGLGKRNCERPGRVVNISSVSGGFSVPFLGAYAGAKHALEGMTQALRRELLSQRIHVCAIEPHFIKTPAIEHAVDSELSVRYQDTMLAKLWTTFLDGFRGQISKAKEPSIVTDAVIHALESDKPKSRYPLDPSWRLSRWLPDTVFDKMLFKDLGLDKLMASKTL